MIEKRDDSPDEIGHLTGPNCDIECVINGSPNASTSATTATTPSQVAPTTPQPPANYINSDQASTSLTPPPSDLTSLLPSSAPSFRSGSLTGQSSSSQNWGSSTSATLAGTELSIPTTQELQPTVSIDASAGTNHGNPVQNGDQTGHLPAILGGTLAGLILIALLSMFLIWRRRTSRPNLEYLVETFPSSSEKASDATRSACPVGSSELSQPNVPNNAESGSILSLNTSACHGIAEGPGSDFAVAGSPEPAYPSSLIEPLIPHEDLERLAAISTPTTLLGLTGSKGGAKGRGRSKGKRKKAKTNLTPTDQFGVGNRKIGEFLKSRTRNRSRSNNHGPRSQPDEEIQPIEPQATGNTVFDEPPPPWSDSDVWTIPRYSSIQDSRGSTPPLD